MMHREVASDEDSQVDFERSKHGQTMKGIQPNSQINIEIED